jgi:hypothetical protein
MIDGSSAEFNAIENNFPKAKIIMCWFHVTKCVRDWCKDNGLVKRHPNLCKMTIDDINDLHHTLSFHNFCEELRRIELKWSQYQELSSFHQYFIKQWCYHDGQWSRVHRWQIFQTPHGAAATNNPVESFNKEIKSVYTKGSILNVYSFLLIVLQRIINQYSFQPKPFKWYREPDFDVIDKANQLVREQFHFVQCGQDVYTYSDNEKANKYIVGIQDNVTYPGYKFVYCQCCYYQKKYVCKHTVALAIQLNLKLKGFELKQNLPENNKKGRTANAKSALEKPTGELITKPPVVPKRASRRRDSVIPYKKNN